VKPRVRPLTYAGYKVNVEKHLIPSIGRIRLDQLTPLHVQEMINDCLNLGLSTKSVVYIHQVLQTKDYGSATRTAIPENRLTIPSDRRAAAPASQ
jgi:hypothetical protein